MSDPEDGRGNGEGRGDETEPPDSTSGRSDETGLEAASPATPEAELEALRRERDDLTNQLLRLRAEFDNYRKRVERDRAQAGLEASAAIFRALVPTVDNLDRALDAAAADDPLRAGVELIRRDFLALLESHGVETEDPTGQPFDPERHQALAHEPVPGHDEGIVVETFRKGYRYKDRLLRPALVKVSKGDEAPAEGPEAVH